MLTFLRIERPTSETLRPERRGGVDHLLDAVDVRGEAGDDDPALGAGEHLLEVRSDVALGGREAGPVGVGRVAAQQQHALAAELGQARDVGRRAVDRGLVELVVAGDEHRAELGAQRDRARVGDRVGHVDELERERSERQLLAGREVLELAVAQVVLVELRARHRDREPAAVHGRRAAAAELAQHPRQRAEMVLVTVGDDDRLDVVGPLAQVAEVGQHEVDPEHVGGREAQPGVDDDDPAVVLDDRHVLADLAQPAERQDAESADSRWRQSSSPWRSSIARTVAVSARRARRRAAAARPTSRPSRFSAALVVQASGATPMSR